jgi:hypothetical protein
VSNALDVVKAFYMGLMASSNGLQVPAPESAVMPVEVPAELAFHIAD